MNVRSLGNHRRFAIERIKRLVAPHMRDSGYRKALDPSKGLLAGSRALRVWSPPDRRNGQLQNLGGFVVQEVWCVTEDGVMTDAYGGGAVTTYWAAIPLEDLARLETMIPRWLAA